MDERCPRCGSTRIKVRRQPLWYTDQSKAAHPGEPDEMVVVRTECLDCTDVTIKRAITTAMFLRGVEYRKAERFVELHYDPASRAVKMPTGE